MQQQIYRVAQKARFLYALTSYALTSSYEITLSTTPQFIATIENKTTSVTTHFKSAAARRTYLTFDVKTVGCDS